MTDYQPAPIDTSDVELPSELSVLVERLAENAHDLWARQRMADGWTLGDERNDAELKHPGLVPYDELPDSEKEYDRIMAIESIKSIVALGYDVSAPAGDA